MDSNTHKPFNRRAFASITMTLSTIGLVVTGLNIVDPNRSERGAAVTSPEVHTWTHAHLAYAVLFVGFSIWHIVMNRKALLNHVKAINPRALRISREAAWAIGTIAVVTLVVALHAE